MHAIVMGATGLVGASLVEQLAGEDIDTVVLARRDGPFHGPTVHWHVIDPATLGRQHVPKGTNAAFCALGTTIKKAGSKEAFRAVDHDLVVRFAEACRQQGVMQFHVVSAIGADPKSRFFYNRVKGEMEADVEALGFPTLAIYRPSLLLGERAERRPAERVSIALARVVGSILPAKVRGIPAETVARAMLHDARGAKAGTRVHENADIARLGG